jgi:hypothetical protein
MSWGAVSSRTAWIFLAVCVVGELGSSALFLASANFDSSKTFDPKFLLTTGARGADIARLASLLDMFGYLAAIPIALYFQSRFRDETGITFFTLSGVLFLVMGAMAAVMFAFALAPMIRDYATASSAKDASETVFVALYRFTVFGIWQTLNGFLAGTWMLGVGWIAWRRRARALASVLVVFGLIYAGGAAAHISGIGPGS